MSATLLALVLVIHLEVGQCQEHLTSDANGGLRLGLNLFGPNRPFSLSNIFNRPSRNSRPTSDPHFANLPRLPPPVQRPQRLQPQQHQLHTQQHQSQPQQQQLQSQQQLQHLPTIGPTPFLRAPPPRSNGNGPFPLLFQPSPVAPVSTRPQVFPAQSGIPSASGFQPAAKWPPHLSHSTPSTINHFESTTSHPAVHPAQFALSANHINQQQQDQLNLVEPPKLEASATSFANDQRQESSKSVDCGAGNDLGFCTFSATYPRESVKRTMERCQSTANAMYAEIPDDLSSLADVHSVINGSQLEAGHSAWSWADYKKESACDSQLRFIEPQVALDRSGQWKVVVQSEGFLQRVAIDVCRHVNDVCKVFTDCGRKSRCVQRYSYHPLMVLDPKQIHNCPTMQVFRFPTSCVCHVEVHKPHGITESLPSTRRISS